MKATQSDVIATFGGRDIFWITLENEHRARIRITNYGCIIQSIIVPDKYGDPTDITLGFDRVEDYYSDHYLANSPYFGAIVGRYTNRIANAQYEYDGVVFHLSSNDGRHQLHSSGSLSQNVWDIESLEDGKVTFSYVSPDGDNGFPGNLKTSVIYELTDNNELIYSITAVTDKPTPVNMTNHAYFNLHGDGSFIGDHILEIPAAGYLAQDVDLLPTGQVLPVAGTRYDFNVPKPIAADWDPLTGYDQAFVLQREYGQWGRVASVRSEKTGISLDVFSFEPVVQFYTAGSLNRMRGKNSCIYDKYSGFCLETHHHPNAVNIPAFPDTILRPGDIYQQRTMFRFGHSH